jgi:hypothetical protein
VQKIKQNVPIFRNYNLKMHIPVQKKSRKFDFFSKKRVQNPLLNLPKKKENTETFSKMHIPVRKIWVFKQIFLKIPKNTLFKCIYQCKKFTKFSFFRKKMFKKPHRICHEK